MLRIDIRSLKPGVHELELSPTPGDLEMDPERFSSVHVNIRMDYSGRQLTVIVQASANAVLQCDRTLVDFTKAISGSWGVLFAPPETIEQEDEGEDDVRPLLATDEEIDLTDIVRDTLLLAIPVRKIAPGAEDADIPTAFGQPDESEVDPRWRALKALKDQASEDAP